MKKIISLLVVIALIAAGLVIAAFATGEPTILLERVPEAKPGDEVVVAVVMENNPGFMGMQLTVEYDDTALELTNIAKGEILVGNYDANPASGIVVFGADADVTASGTLLTLTFKVKEAATEGAHAVTVVFEEIYNEADEDIEFAIEAGSVNVVHVCDPEKFEDVAEVPAECEKEGTEAHQKCSCGKLYQNGVEVTEADLVIEALNHPNAADAEYVYEYLNEEETLWDLVLYCPDCGKELERHVPGTEMNPLFIMDQNEATFDVLEYSFNAPAGETTHLLGYSTGGMILTVKAENIEIVVDGVTLEPVDGVYTYNVVSKGGRGRPEPNYITVTNKGEADTTIDMTFTHPEGTFMNPADLVIGYNCPEVPADGYLYNWTAETETYLSITMYGTNWTYNIRVDRADGTSYYGDNHSTVVEEDEKVITMEVVHLNAGDVVVLAVGTADWTAGTIEFEAAIAAGTAEDPVQINFRPFWNEDGTEASINVLLPAGEVTLGAYNLSGMALTVNGEETAVTSGMMRYPDSFVVAGEEAAVYTVAISYPVGSRENPDELVEGDNATEIPAGTQGYYYEWTAEEDGTVTITVSAEGGYFFCVSNLTTGVYGSNMWSDSEDLVNPMTLEVKAGETIQVIVNTYDPESPWEAPAGTVNVNFEFTSAPAKTGDPITLVLAAALISGMSVVALTKKKEN